MNVEYKHIKVSCEKKKQQLGNIIIKNEASV